MGYPEPIPILKGKAAKTFKKRLDNFKLTKKQKRMYRDAFERLQCKEDCTGHYKLGQCVGCTRYPYRDKKDNYIKGT